MDDNSRELTIGFIRNDPDSIERIVRKYTVPLRNFIFNMTRDGELSKDAVQETFIKAWKARKKIDPNKNFKTWLFSIGKNATIDLLRKKRDIPISTFDDDDGRNTILESNLDEEPLADEILEKNMSWAMIFEKIKNLAPIYTTIVSLRYEEDLTFEEIAKILNISANTVRSRHSRALKKIKNDLKRPI